MSSEGYDPSASGSGAAADPMIGQIIDKRYRLTSKLGEGGMGEVYAADHLRIARSVAIKLLRAEILTNEEAVARFEQEAMTASSIGHENIIRIEDSGKLEDGRIYLAMELLDGLPFNDLIDQPTPVAPDRLLNILIQTCHGLAAAHNKGIIHRDMKPENIYITHNVDGSDLPKLLDFGIAKVSQAEGENHLTRTGTIFGTPFYMAPEQALGQAVDNRVDVYAMGVIMYEVFCGAVPFGGESFMGILTQHITAEAVLPSVTAQQHGRMMPMGVEDIIVKAMKKEPGERFQSMDELVQALIPIYRGVAGSGMSTYMAAHTPAPGELQAVSGPYPGSGAAPQHVNPHEGSQPYQVPHQPVSAPMGAPTGAPPMGHAPPQSAHYGAQHQSGGYAGSSESMLVPARKSRTGLIIAILLVLAAAGGGAAYVLTQDDGEKEQVASGKDDAADPGNGTIVPDPGTKVDPDPDSGIAPTNTDPVLNPGVAPDAGAVKPDPGPDPVKPELVTVLLHSKPSGAKVYQDGKKIGSTPMMIKVDKAAPPTVVLQLKKYKDEEVTVDGATTKLLTKLERKGKTGGKPDPGDKPDPGPGDKPDPPKVDPCKKNPNLPECMLE